MNALKVDISCIGESAYRERAAHQADQQATTISISVCTAPLNLSVKLNN